jgi:hypothetical protein
MEKLDLKKELKSYFSSKAGKFEILTLPTYNYLTIEGKGDPNTDPSYVQAIEMLYGSSYTLKFQCKKELEMDYVVPPLEGLWWAKDMKTFTTREKSQWSWKMMIMVPSFVKKTDVAKAIKAFASKKPEAQVSLLKYESLKEGLSIQTLHVGPYDAEGPTLTKMHTEFMPENKLTFNGLHHEIYLGDPRKTTPEKLKTILRQPVKKL